MSIALRLHDPELAPRDYDHPQAARTLPQLWREEILPMIRIVEPDPDEFLRKNGEFYLSTLRQWERLMGEVPAGDIDYELLCQWRTQAADQPGRAGEKVSPATVRRHYTYLQALLSRLCAKGVIAAIPKIKLPPVIDHPDRRPPPVYADTFAQILSGAHAWQFTTDPRLPGPFVARGLITALWSTGLRAADLFALEWSHFREHSRNPVHPNLRHPHGWLYTNAGKTGKPVLIPLTEPLAVWVAHARALIPTTDRRGQLFPIGNPYHSGRAANRRNAAREAMQIAAGMEHVYTFQQLRAGANECWNDAEADAGDWLLGHAANRDVNSRHYKSGLRRLLRAVGKLDVPEALLLERPPDGPGSQLTLFS